MALKQGNPEMAEVKYGNIQMPNQIIVEESTPTFAKFIIEPFERGYGHTLGNTLRRILLTSIEGCAILSVKMDGVLHEYGPVKGVIQDMTHIVLNLKGVLIRRLNINDGPREIRTVHAKIVVDDEKLKANRQYVVTVDDLFANSEYEVVNPVVNGKAYEIFTVTEKMTINIELKIGTGTGYVPSERHSFDTVLHEIPIDSCFSPVRLVNYHVENKRVGQDTDFDRLIMQVTTDGRNNPVEALTFAAQLAIKHFKVFESITTHTIHFDKGTSFNNGERDTIIEKLRLPIEEIELSVRAQNCINQAGIEYVWDLVRRSETEMLKHRNFGKKSANEIQEKLQDMGLSLGLDLEGKHGITEAEFEQFIQETKSGNTEK